MVKNRPKTPEIILGTSLIININIFNIFCFSTFSFQYCATPVFCQNFTKKTLNTGSKKYPKDKVEKAEKVKNVNIYHI